MVRETKLYDILGLPPTADEAQIRSAYKKLAIKYHPDKNPDAGDKFAEISMAYETLSDPEKREIYNQYGEEGLKNGGGGGGGFSPEDLFAQFFGGGGGRQQRSGKRKGQNLAHRLTVTLEDLYNGKVTKIAATRDQICSKCTGSGGKTADAVRKCTQCNGHGVRIVMRQLGPMVQQMQVPCPECEGKGEIIKDNMRCPQCRGKKVCEDRKVLEVYIDRGMEHGQKITFSGEADQAPGTEPGDIIVVLECKPHAVFKRQGNDLLMEHTILLHEALCGFQFTVRHLDGRVLVIAPPSGRITRPGDIQCVPGAGMPTWKRPDDKGRLIVKFNVEFPGDGSITPDMAPLLAKFLPTPKPIEVPMDSEEVQLQPVLEQHQNSHAHEEDEDEGHSHGGGGGVSCAQQ